MHSVHLAALFFVISIHGFFADETSHTTNCLASCTSDSCEKACDLLTNSREPYLQVDEDTDANATLHCAGVNVMVIKYNPGNYIIVQSTSRNVWNSVKMVNDSFSIFPNLEAGTLYRYRLYKILDAAITQPEITDWFSTYAVNYQPMKVQDIYVSDIMADKRKAYQVRAEVAFEPAKDRSCSYNVLSWSGEHALINFNLKQVAEFRFELILGYDRNTTVSIAATNDDDTKYSERISTAFVTQSCLEMHKNLSICAPQIVKGLHAEHIYRQGNSYDVLIYWDKPMQEPDNYTILLDLLQDEENVHRLSIPGNLTEVSLFNVPLGSQYEVSIAAESSGGLSPMTTVAKNITKPASEYKFYVEIMIGLPTFIMIVTLIGLLCVQHYKVKKNKFSMEYTHFGSLEQKRVPEESVRKLLRPEYAPGKTEASLIRDEFDILPELLNLKGILGSGAYGIVRLGTLKDEVNNVTKVAVKMLKENPSVEDIKNFQQEITMMKSAGKHPNIVSLIGCCTLYNNPVLIVEYCCKGDLQSYLKKIWQKMVNVAFDHRARFKLNNEDVKNDTGTFLRVFNENDENYQNVQMIANRLYDIQLDILEATESITANDLLNFARQVAIGMEFLSSNRILHRDLAARNVLVCPDRVVKISDFGLSRDIYQENLYRKQGSGKLPLKWMAVEALTHQIYTTYSDVWSFGILLWEIVTMGATPYPGIPTERVLKLLKSGYRMERPPNCGSVLYNIMYSCWNVRPQSRPTFTELKESLDKLLSNSSNNTYLNVSEALHDFEGE